MTILILVFIAGFATGIAATIALYALADRRRVTAVQHYVVDREPEPMEFDR